MANSFNFEVHLARNMLKAVEDAMVMTPFVDRRFTDKVSDRNDLKIDVERCSRFVSTPGWDLKLQDILRGKEQLAIDRTEHVAFTYTEWQKLRNIPKVTEDDIFKAAVSRLAQTVDGAIADELIYCNRIEGNPLTTINSFQQVMAPQTRLGAESVSNSSNMAQGMSLTAFLDYYDRMGVSTEIANSNIQSKNAGALEKMGGYMVSGMNIMPAAVLPVVTTGTRANTAQMAGASQNVNAEDIVNNKLAGQTINIDGLGANATLSRGEKFTIAGLLAFNYATQLPKHYLQQFVVLEDVTADGAGAATVTIAPSIIPFVAGANSAQAYANNAYATVTAAPADNAVVTFVAPQNSSMRIRAALTKDSVTLMSARPTSPFGNPDARIIRTKRRDGSSRSGIALRVWPFSDPQTSSHAVRFDIAFGTKMVNIEKTCGFGGPA